MFGGKKAARSPGPAVWSVLPPPVASNHHLSAPPSRSQWRVIAGGGETSPAAERRLDSENIFRLPQCPRLGYAFDPASCNTARWRSSRSRGFYGQTPGL